MKFIVDSNNDCSVEKVQRLLDPQKDELLSNAFKFPVLYQARCQLAAIDYGMHRGKPEILNYVQEIIGFIEYTLVVLGQCHLKKNTLFFETDIFQKSIHLYPAIFSEQVHWQFSCIK